MTIIRDKTPSKFEFKIFTYYDLKASLQEILGSNIISKNGENGLENNQVLFAGKGTFSLQVYKIIGFCPADVWQRLNEKQHRSEFPMSVCDDNLTVIAQEITSGNGGYVALPSAIFSDLAKLNRGFRRIP